MLYETLVRDETLNAENKRDDETNIPMNPYHRNNMAKFDKSKQYNTRQDLFIHRKTIKS